MESFCRRHHFCSVHEAHSTEILSLVRAPPNQTSQISCILPDKLLLYEHHLITFRTDRIFSRKNTAAVQGRACCTTYSHCSNSDCGIYRPPDGHFHTHQIPSMKFPFLLPQNNLQFSTYTHYLTNPNITSCYKTHISITYTTPSPTGFLTSLSHCMQTFHTISQISLLMM